MPTSEHPTGPIPLFYSYSKKDKALRDRLETHLSLLRDQGIISGWHDRCIEPGAEWEKAIHRNLEDAGIILLLVSADFLATPYIRDIEITRAMERHEQGTARVIPVILRPVSDWQDAPFGKLHALPQNGKPVTKWRDREEAFANVSRGIRDAVEKLAKARGKLRAPPTVTNPGRKAPSESWQEPYFAVQGRDIERLASWFVGRADVIRAFDRFVETHPRGYFIVAGGPGLGKSALVAHLVRTRNYIHHLVSLSGGRSNHRLILRSLLAQVLERNPVGLAIPDAIPDLTKAFEEALEQLASKGEPVVVILDSFDQLIAEANSPIPFLVTDALPDGAYFLVTTRPDDWIRSKPYGLYSLDQETIELRPLQPKQCEELLRMRKPDLGPIETGRITAFSQGNPLYLHAVLEELKMNPHYDLRDLPSRVEDFFFRATGEIRDRRNPILNEVLGILCVARTPLSLADLSQITGARERDVLEEGLRPIRQFLTLTDDRYTFYHHQFQEFVTDELHFSEEVKSYHRLLAEWLRRPELSGREERHRSLAYHLYESHDLEGLLEALTPEFLADKLNRMGYTVLDDVELIAKAMLERDDPDLVERCVELVEGLRSVLGSTVIEEARGLIQGVGATSGATRSIVVPPRLPTIPGIDLYVGMLPRLQLSADFFTATAGSGRLVVALGDAPGAGLKSAFIARFVANLVRHKSEAVDEPQPVALIDEVARAITAHDFFDTLALQCVVLDPARNLLTLANAGLPYPVLHTARRGKCDRLPVSGPLIFARASDEPPLRFRQRRMELDTGDILVMVTDGLTESRGPGGTTFGYRFADLVESLACRDAHFIGESILREWREFPRRDDHFDDASVLVAKVAATNRSQSKEG
jgi:hypothetical protein